MRTAAAAEKKTKNLQHWLHNLFVSPNANEKESKQTGSRIPNKSRLSNGNKKKIWLSTPHEQKKKHGKSIISNISVDFIADFFAFFMPPQFQLFTQQQHQHPQWCYSICHAMVATRTWELKIGFKWQRWRECGQDKYWVRLGWRRGVQTRQNIGSTNRFHT